MREEDNGQVLALQLFSPVSPQSEGPITNHQHTLFFFVVLNNCGKDCKVSSLACASSSQQVSPSLCLLMLWLCSYVMEHRWFEILDQQLCIAAVVSNSSFPSHWLQDLMDDSHLCFCAVVCICDSLD